MVGDGRLHGGRHGSSVGNGAQGGDADVANNLTDPSWLLDRAMRRLREDRSGSPADLAAVVRASAELLLVLGVVSNQRAGVRPPVPLGEPVKALRAWEAALQAAEARAAAAEHEQRGPTITGGRRST